MYPRSFLCEEAKIKQRTPLKKELCEIGEGTIWESRFTSFFFNWHEFFSEFSYNWNFFSFILFYYSKMHEFEIFRSKQSTLKKCPDNCTNSYDIKP